MATRFSTGTQNTSANAVGTAFDGGAAINIYTGAQPSSPNDAATGTLLATLPMSSDAFSTAVNGVITSAVITEDSSADATGVAGWFRMYRTGDTAPGSAATATDVRIDGNITATGGGGDMEMDNTQVIEQGTVEITQLTITFPAG